MDTPIRAAFGYFFLLLVVRVLPRRPGAQMTPFEFVIVFLVGGAIIRATVGADSSVTNCTIAIVAVCLIHNLVAWLKTKSRVFGTLVDGTPLVLVQNGQWRPDVMRKMRLAKEDVMAAARGKGVRSIHEVHYAVLERNGAISIIKQEKK